MNDLPPPDVLDQRGRLNRLVAAVCAGVVCGAATYALVYALAGHDYEARHYYTARSAGRFIFYFTGLAAVVGGTITHAVLRHRARKRELEVPVPKAEVRR